MKLRNKKTGETGFYLHTHRDHKTGVLKVAVLKDGVPFSEFEPHEPIYDYDSLAELNKEWEDYRPKEPLIKDEKIRKLVSDWAKLTQTNKILTVERRTTRGEKLTEFFSQEKSISLEILDRFDCLNMKEYTIAELCGEEEECES